MSQPIVNSTPFHSVMVDIRTYRLGDEPQLNLNTR